MRKQAVRIYFGRVITIATPLLSARNYADKFRGEQGGGGGGVVVAALWREDARVQNDRLARNCNAPLLPPLLLLRSPRINRPKISKGSLSFSPSRELILGA